MNKWLGGFLLGLGIPFTVLTIYALDEFVRNWNIWYSTRNMSAAGFGTVFAGLILGLVMSLFVDRIGFYYWFKH